jgi:peroxiredoxin
MGMPAITLPSTPGGPTRVDVAPGDHERLVVYAYPMTGRPEIDNPDGWDEIPGARGCTPESCGFRDHADELAAAGAGVLGVSTQSSDYQREAAERLRLPYPLLSDHELRLAHALALPTMTVDVRDTHDSGGSNTLLKRLTLVIRAGMIEHIFYHVFPPDEHAGRVLAWLNAKQAETQHT